MWECEAQAWDRVGRVEFEQRGIAQWLVVWSTTYQHNELLRAGYDAHLEN